MKQAKKGITVTGQKINWYPSISMAYRAERFENQVGAKAFVRFEFEPLSAHKNVFDRTCTSEKAESTDPEYR